MTDYKDTLNLPSTAFPMRANLAQREPKMLEAWYEMDLYGQIRAQKSGLIHVKVKCNTLVEKGDVLATITDPYGKMKFKVLAPNKGYIINVNQAAIVHQGDAIFHISVNNLGTKKNIE